MSTIPVYPTLLDMMDSCAPSLDLSRLEDLEMSAESFIGLVLLAKRGEIQLELLSGFECLRTEDWSKCEFSDLKLPRNLLMGGDFSSTNFSGSSLPSLRLWGGSRLSYTYFIKSEMPEANLSRVRGEYCRFNSANLTGADFSHCVLRLTSFRRAKATRSNFHNANLSRSDFSYATLQHANFRNANLTECHFDHCNLTQADLIGSQVQGADFRKAKITEEQREYVEAHGAKV